MRTTILGFVSMARYVFADEDLVRGKNGTGRRFLYPRMFSQVIQLFSSFIFVSTFVFGQCSAAQDIFVDDEYVAGLGNVSCTRHIFVGYLILPPGVVVSVSVCACHESSCRCVCTDRFPY